ncbi:RNA polymerase sigma factor [Rubrivirga sp.]|uniref:RNA polymerase sigma factor n=1 Tax=Rubrivirga sp. TaxID=1885344 RepID=UPI003B524C6A
MTPETYRHLLSVARRHAVASGNAGDLLHDALIVAARQDVDLDTDSGQRWLSGVLRNLARHQARTDGRRERREAAFASADAPEPDAPLADDHRPVERWETMPSASRRVVALALHGLGKDEICAVLGLSDTAFRQRLTVARRALGPLPADLQREAIALAYDRRAQRGDDLALGLVRRALVRSLRSTDAVGTHDPDGHLMVVGRIV